MAAKKYSAGAIFLQVVPVFANVQRAIEDHAKEIDRSLGDQMEKSGEKAGQRAGKAIGKGIEGEAKKAAEDYAGHFETSIKRVVRSAEREIARIDLSTASEKMLSDLDLVKKKLRELSDQDFNVDFDSKKVIADLAAVRAATDALTKGKHELNVDSNIRKVVRDIQAGLDFVDKEIERGREIVIDADIKPAERAMTSFEKSFKKTAEKAAGHLSGSMNKEAKKLRAELQYLENLRIGVDISSNQARAELKEILTDLERLQREDPNIDVKVDAAKAIAEVAALDIALEKIEADEIDIQVDVDTGAARAKLFALRASGDDASNSFRSFNVILLATASLGPALVPVLGAIAGGLLALGPAAAVAGAGLGSVLVGFSGLGDAITALQAQQDQMAANTASMVSAERNGAQAVADARRAAARAIESALDQQRDAQERYRDSIDDVREAEQALKDAREAARGTGQDLDLDIRQNALAIDQALLDSFDATVNYNSVMADGSSTNAEQEQARIDREEALLRLEELRAEQKELAREKKKWDKEGVNGVEAVEDAQESLRDAIEAQRDAYEALGEAARNVDRARVDGARAIQRAMEGQAEAMAGVDTQAQNVATAFSKLGPAGQEFALFLFGLRDGFREFRDDIQQVMLPAVQEAIEGFLGSKSASVARDALIGLARAFGQFAISLSKSFQGQAWTNFFEMLVEYGPQIMATYGDAFISFLEGMASLLVVLAPFALRFAEGFRDLMDTFASWAGSKEGAEGIQRFLDYVERVGPKVMEFFGALGGAIMNVLEALAPYADVMLGLLTDFLEFIANIDPKVLGVVLGVVLALVTASQVAYAVMNLFMAGAALFASPIGIIVFALVGIGLAIAYLWETNEGFRDFVTDAWEKISGAFMKAWENDIKPALEKLWAALEELWEEVLKPFFEWLGPILLLAVEEIIPMLAWVFAEVVNEIAYFITEILIPVIKWLVRTFRDAADRWQDRWERLTNFLSDAWNRWKDRFIWLVDRITSAGDRWMERWNTVVDWVKEKWGNLSDSLSDTYDKYIKPIFDTFTETVLPALKDAFDTTVDKIKGIWEKLRKYVGAPVKFVIETVLNNGIIAGFNKVANFVGSDGIDNIPVPNWTYARGGIFGRTGYATGGVLPGYTPGADVHHFTSPTGGRLNLSGGEAIMRPEWTAAMGPSFVDQMNDLARRGGRRAIERAMGFAKGGVFWPTTFRSLSDDYPGHTGVDISLPGTGDYGKPVFAAHTGVAKFVDYGAESYGQSVWINGKDGLTTIYGHLSKALVGATGLGQLVQGGQKIGEIGSTGNSSGPHLHFEVRPGMTRAAALAYLGNGTIPNDEERKGARFPGWIVDIAKNPIGYFKDMLTGPLGTLKEKFGESPMLGSIMGAPAKIVGAMGQKIWGMMPEALHDLVGGAKAVGLKAAGEGAGVLIDVYNAVGGATGWFGRGDGEGGDAPSGDYRRGGVLPYNGTMKYDAGGYLPPGMTTVMNLTGKPEPVFTNEQWNDIGGDGPGAKIHYEPHFEGSDLTAEDVAGDLNFTFRRISRGGKYEGVGAP